MKTPATITRRDRRIYRTAWPPGWVFVAGFCTGIFCCTAMLALEVLS